MIDIPDRSGPPRDVNAYRYGVLDLAIAQEWGYDRPPDPASDAVQAYGSTLNPAQIEAIGDPDDQTSCTSEVRRSISLGDDPRWEDLDRVVQLQEASFRHAESHPQVRRAGQRWSSCMKEATGLDLSGVVEAGALGVSDQLGDREIEVGMADVGCKASSGVVAAYIAVESACQRERIRENQDISSEAHLSAMPHGAFSTSTRSGSSYLSFEDSSMT